MNKCHKISAAGQKRNYHTHTMTRTDNTHNNFKMTQWMQIQKPAGQTQFGTSTNATLSPGGSHTRYHKSVSSSS